MADETQASQFALLKQIPQWFVPGIGIIYATGFLITSSFFDRFGLRQSSADFFKAKYMYAGIVYWLFPAIIIVPLYGFYLVSQYGKEKSNNGDSQPLMGHRIQLIIPSGIKLPNRFTIYLPSALLTINLLLSFYIVAIFLPPGFTTRRHYGVPSLFFVTVFGLITIQAVTKYVRSQSFGGRARWVLCAGVVLGLDWYCFKGSVRFLWEILYPEGWYFFLFLLFLVFVLERLRVRARGIEHTRQRAALKIIGGCVCFALYYFSVLAFSLRIFPYIPVIKGGGDYSDAPNAKLCFQETNGRFIQSDLVAPDAVVNPCTPSIELQIIEETSTSLFVANPKDADGPKAWRLGKKPVVYEIRRDKVGSITYLNH